MRSFSIAFFITASAFSYINNTTGATGFVPCFKLSLERAMALGIIIKAKAIFYDTFVTIHEHKVAVTLANINR